MSSQTVDQRVVQMEFDNKQFEANAKETISTLDKLKQSLKLDESAKSFNNISQSANKIDLSGISSSLDAVSDRFSAFGIVGLTVLQRLTNAAIDFGANLLSKVTAPLNQIKTGGWNRALNIENAMFKMSGLLGDEFESLQTTIDETINHGVKDTAYSYDAAASAMSQLLASGVEFRGESQDMKKALRGISGVAAMTGASFEDISHVFTRIAGNGRLMAIDLQSLSSRGFNAAAALGKQLGKTEAQIREMVHDGKLDFQTFANAMDDAFGEHAKRGNETFTGALSNIKAALSRTGQGFGQSLQTNLRDILNSIRPNINKFNKNYVGQLVDDFDVLMKSARAIVLNLFGDEKTEAKLFLAWVPSAIHSAENIFLGLVGIFGAVRKAFEGVFPKATRSKVIIFWSKILQATTKFRDMFTDARKFADPFISLIGEAKDKVDETVAVAEDLEEIAKRVISGEFGNGEVRFKALEKLGYNYKLVQNKVNELLGCNYRYKLSEEELAQAEKASAKAQEKKNTEYSETEKRFLRMEKALHGMTEEDEARIGSLQKVVQEDKKRYDILDNITDTAKIFASVIRIVQSAGEALNKVVIQPFLETGLPILLENILSITGAIGRKLSEFADYVDESKIFEIILQGIVDAFFAIASGVSFAYGKLVDFKNWFLELPIVSSAISKVSEFFENLPENIENTRQKLEDFKNTIANLPGVQLLLGALSTLKETFKSFAETKLGELSTWFEQFRESKSPDWNPFAEAINWISEKIGIIVKGVIDIANYVWPIVEPFLKLAASGAVKVFKDLADILSKLPDIFSKLFKDGPPDLEGVREFAEGVYNKLDEEFRKIDWGNIGDYVKQAFGLYLIFRLAQMFKGGSSLLSSGTQLLQTARGTFAQANKAINALTANLKADMILKIAEAIGILSLAMIAMAIAQTKYDLPGAAGCLLIVALGISKIITAFSKIGLNRFNVQVTTLGDMLKLALSKFVEAAGVAVVAIGVAGAILIFIFAIKNLMGMLDEKNVKAFNRAVKTLLIGVALLIGGIVLIMGIITAFKKLGNMSFGLDLVGIGVAMIGLAAGVFILCKAIQSLQGIGFRNMQKAGIAMLALMLGLSALAAVSKNASILKCAVYILAMALALNVLLLPLAKINEIQQSEGGDKTLSFFKAIALGFAIFAGAMAASTKLLDVNSVIKMAGAILVISAVLPVMAAALWLFSQFNVIEAAGGILVAITVLGTLALIVGVIAKMLPWDVLLRMEGLAGALLMIAAAVLVFSAAIAVAGIALPIFANGLADFGKVIRDRTEDIATGFLVLITAIVAAIALGVIASQAQIAVSGYSLLMALSRGLTMATPGLLQNLGIILLLGVSFIVTLLEKLAPKVVDGIIRTINAIANSVMGRKDELAAAIVRVIYTIWAIIIQAFMEIFVGFGGLLADLVGNIPVIGEEGAKKIHEGLDNLANGVSQSLDENYARIGREVDEHNDEMAGKAHDGAVGATEAAAAGYEEGSPRAAAAAINAADAANEGYADTVSNGTMSEASEEAVTEAAESMESQEPAMENAGGGLGGSALKGFMDMFGLDESVMASIQNADGTFDVSNMPGLQGFGSLLTETFGQDFDLTSASEEQLAQMGELFSGDGDYAAMMKDGFQGMVDGSTKDVDYSGYEAAADTGVMTYNARMETVSQDYKGAQIVVDESVETITDANDDFKRGAEGNWESYNSGVASKKTAVVTATKEVTGAAVAELNNTPKQAKASGSNFIITGWIEGIKSALDKAKSAGKDVLKSSTDGMTDTDKKSKSVGETAGSEYSSGVSSKADDANKAGKTLKNEVVSGTDGVYGKMYGAGYDAGEGFYDGVNHWAGKIATKAYNMVSDAVTAARNAEDANSPSRKFMQLGEWAGEGFVIGLKHLSGDVSQTSYNMAREGIHTMQNVVSRISDLLDTNIDYEPTIRPVMDLSNIEEGAALVNGAFANMNSYIPVSAVASTSRIAASNTGKFSTDNVNAEAPVSGDTYNYTQNNYSPKALSRLDIYRQTRNMFAMMKGQQANA